MDDGPDLEKREAFIKTYDKGRVERMLPDHSLRERELLYKEATYTFSN